MWFYQSNIFLLFTATILLGKSKILHVKLTFSDNANESCYEKKTFCIKVIVPATLCKTFWRRFSKVYRRLVIVMDGHILGLFLHLCNTDSNGLVISSVFKGFCNPTCQNGRATCTDYNKWWWRHHKKVVWQTLIALSSILSAVEQSNLAGWWTIIPWLPFASDLDAITSRLRA